MDWDLKGSTIEAMYLNEVPVTGVVTLSRIKNDGISHHVELSKAFRYKGSADKCIVNRYAGEIVVVDHKSITRIIEVV